MISVAYNRVLLCSRSYITMMPKLRQALVEFEKLEAAVACVSHCQVRVTLQDKQGCLSVSKIPPFVYTAVEPDIHHGPPHIFQLFHQSGNHPVSFRSRKVILSFSNFISPPRLFSLPRSPYGVSPNSVGEPNDPPMNHILLFTIFNPLYPITVVCVCACVCVCVCTCVCVCVCV